MAHAARICCVVSGTRGADLVLVHDGHDVLARFLRLQFVGRHSQHLERVDRFFLVLGSAQPLSVRPKGHKTKTLSTSLDELNALSEKVSWTRQARTRALLWSSSRTLNVSSSFLTSSGRNGRASTAEQRRGRQERQRAECVEGCHADTHWMGPARLSSAPSP